jgi:hypothetical protein
VPLLQEQDLQREQHQLNLLADVAQVQLPTDKRQRRHQPVAAGHDVAHHVRQRLLHQPALPAGAPALRPAAHQRWQHRQHGPELRIQRVGVQQRVHGGDGEHGKHQPQDGLARVGGRKILPRNFLKKDGLARGDQAQMLQGELLEKRRRAHMHHSSKRQELIRSQYQFA